jgi:hypothetical protein
MTGPEPAADAETCKFKEKHEPPADPVITLVKWLVPTAGVLFGLVGYVIDAAHRSLLGFPTEDGGFDSSGRVQDATDFLRFLVTLLGDRLVTLASLNSISMGGHWTLVLFCSAMLALVIAQKRLAASKLTWLNKPGSWLASALPFLVVVFVALKFFCFDAPAMRIESVIVGSGIPKEAAKAEAVSRAASGLFETQAKVVPTKVLRPRLEDDKSAPVGSFISGRALRLWNLMVCSRVGGEGTKDDLPSAAEAKCSAANSELTSAAAKTLLAGEFDAGLSIAILIAVASTALLLRRTPANTALALLAFAYLLTVPYAWGKFLKPVNFPYALVRTESGMFYLAQKAPEKPLDVKQAYAFVLVREGGSVTILHGVFEPCSRGNSVALRFASFPASKVVAIEQIYRLDVIEWALRTERDCDARDR